MRKPIAALLLAVLVAVPAAGRSGATILAACSENARATSLTWDDPGEECSDFFILEAAATVVVRLEPGDFGGTLGAALVDFETTVATFKRTFVGGHSIDGPVDMEVNLPAGNWRLRAFAGVTPRQRCAPEVPLITSLVGSCSLAPGAAIGEYAASVRLA